MAISKEANLTKSDLALNHSPKSAIRFLTCHLKVSTVFLVRFAFGLVAVP